MKKEIITQTVINATPTKVWSVLTDFNKYTEWNPFIEYVIGDVTLGNNIKVKLGGTTFKPKVTAFDIHKSFAWLGHLGFKGVFDGAHKFELIDNADGTTTFVQSEQFNGILVGLLAKKLDTEITDNFKAMNEALKNRVETMS